MSQSSSETSYIEALRAARAAVDAYMPEFDAEQERNRLSFQQLSAHWAAVAEMAIRALGQGADAGEVVAIVQGKPPEKFVDVQDFVRMLDQHIISWILREAAIKP